MWYRTMLLNKQGTARKDGTTAMWQGSASLPEHTLTSELHTAMDYILIDRKRRKLCLPDEVSKTWI